jgi:hypothetical protein
VTVLHAVLFKLKDDAPDDAVESILEGFAVLRDRVPEIRSYRYGPDLGLTGGAWDVALVAEFDSADDWQTYRDHPAHLAFIDERITPFVETRTSVQLEA